MWVTITGNEGYRVAVVTFSMDQWHFKVTGSWWMEEAQYHSLHSMGRPVDLIQANDDECVEKIKYVDR